MWASPSFLRDGSGRRSSPLLVLVAALLAFTGSAPAVAVDYVWNNPNGGSWNTAANWTPNGVPDDHTETATIDLAGTYTVTLDSNAGPRSVMLGGASGTQTLSLLAQLSLWSTSQCSITVNPNGVLAISGTGRLHLSNPIVPPNVLTNHGVVDLRDDVGRITSEGANLLVNTGLVKKSGGAGTATISVNNVTNTGTFDAQAGTLSVLSNFGTLQSSGAGNAFSAQAGATLAIAGFANGANTFADTTFGGAGAKTLRLNSTCSGTIGATNTILAEGAIYGTFSLNGRLDWQGGNLGGDGNLDMTIPAGAALVLSGSGYKSLRNSTGFTTRLTNSGTITFAGPAGFQSGGTPTVVNTASGLIDLASDTGIHSGGNLSLANAGTLRKSAGTGTSYLQAIALTNTGTVSVQAGTLAIDSTFIQTAGRTELAGGSLITPMFSLAQFTGGVLTGAGAITGRLDVSGAAQVRPGTSPGIITLNDAEQQLAGTLYVELNGTTPGTGHDQIVAATSGSVYRALKLAGNLVVSIGAPLPVGTTLTIIDVGGGNQATSGAFTGLPEGATFTVQGYVLKISYVGGTGNDVVLTVLSNSGLPCEAFTDVDAASPFCPSVLWMKQRGVTVGCGATTYCPLNSTTRDQMAAFMKRLGGVITAPAVSVEASPGALNPNANPILCSSADQAAATYERRMGVDAVFMGQGQGSGDLGVELVESVNAGTTWIALGPVLPTGIADGRWSNVRLNAARDVAPSEVVRYALRVSRVSGAGVLAASACQLRLLPGNRDPGSAADRDD